MSMTVPVAQLRIARDIRQAEAALNEALLRHSSIFTTVAEARLQTDVGAFAAQEALLRLAKSQQSLLDARPRKSAIPPADTSPPPDPGL